MPHHPSILTNMAFWQSREWTQRVDSIYELNPSGGDPQFMPWWREAWHLFRRRKQYDIILTMGVRESFAYAALARLVRDNRCHIMTEVFIDAPKPGLVWRIKTRWYRFLAKKTAGIITNSSEEMKTNALRYHMPGDRLLYVPLSTTIAAPRYIEANDGYYFCGGRTLRDYKTLAAVIADSPARWVIVAGRGDLSGVTLPPHADFREEIDREEYLRLLKAAKLVVLPLLRTERATGQVVVLEAMSYGKPVITTDAPGTRDIVRHMVNGILVAPEDPAAIRAAIALLESDTSLCESLTRAAMHDIDTEFSTERHAKLKLDAVESIWAMPPR